MRGACQRSRAFEPQPRQDSAETAGSSALGPLAPVAHFVGGNLAHFVGGNLAHFVCGNLAHCVGGSLAHFVGRGGSLTHCVGRGGSLAHFVGRGREQRDPPLSRGEWLAPSRHRD